MNHTPLPGEGVENKNLKTMSLHEITYELGAEGLEQRFRLEAQDLKVDEQDKARIITALDLALKMHQDQKRGTDPYSTHFLRVATRVIHHFGVEDVNTIIASLLHDTVEDHPENLVTELAGNGNSSVISLDNELLTEPKEAALHLIALRYGLEVAQILDDVTNPEFTGATSAERQEEYREHVRDRLLYGNPKMRIIKASDLVDNLAGQRHNPDIEGRKRFIRKYLPLIPAVIEAIMQPDTPLSPKAKEYIIGQFLATVEFANEQLLS